MAAILSRRLVGEADTRAGGNACPIVFGYRLRACRPDDLASRARDEV